MEQWMKKLSGAMIASVLALTLSTKASAEGDPPTDIGEGDGVLILGEAPADPAGDSEGAGVTDLTKGGDAPADGSGVVGSDPTVGGGTGSDTDQNDSPYISVDNHDIYPIVPDENGSHNQSEGPIADADSVGFYGYDAGDSQALSDDSLYMVDCTAGTVEVHNCDLHIASAGVNQIGTIDAQEGGDVYVAGTGIMLVDEVLLSEGKGFYLQPIQGLYDSGTVAVFVKTSAGCLSDLVHDIDIENLSSYQTEGITPYVMINGSMTGILDDDYVLPDGISLIMPSGCNIEMMSPGTFNGEGGEIVDLPESDDPEHPYLIGDACSQTFLSSSSLTIPSSSSITVDKGASMKLSGRDITAPLTTSKETITYAPVLNVEGYLINNGSITGKGIVMRSTHEKAPEVPNSDGVPEYVKPIFSKTSGKMTGSAETAEIGSIGNDIFVIHRWNENIVRFTYLDHELYDYLCNSSDIDEDEFNAMTSNNLDYTGEGYERWGVHTPVFSFRTSSMEIGPLYSYSEVSESIIVDGNVYSLQPMFSPGTQSTSADLLRLVFRFQWGIETLGMGSGEAEDDFITGTIGAGKLGGGAGDYKGDMDKSKLIFGTGKTTDKSAANHSLVLVVTDKEICYNLAAYYDGEQIFSLNGKVTVRFDYPAPETEGPFFVVFRNGNGSLTAFAARYDRLAGQLVFNGDKLGDFVVVCPDGFDGELFSEEFYAFLETIDSVKALKASF